MRNRILVVAILTTTAGGLSAQASTRGWWARLGIGAGSNTQLCDPQAASWSCGTHGSSLLGRLDLAVGRTVTSQVAVGFEVSPVLHHVKLDPYNSSRFLTTSGMLIGRFYPLPHKPVFVQVGGGLSVYRLRELNNGDTFHLHGAGWVAAAGLGAEFTVFRALAVGPFLRLDHREFGAADVFFRHLQQRDLTFGMSLLLR